MRISSILIPAVVFIGLFVGMSNFGMDYYDRMGVEAEGFEDIEQEQAQLEEDWTEKGADSSTFDSDESIIERAAGAVFIPRIAGDIINIGSTYRTVLDNLESYELVPSWFITIVTTVVSLSIFIALLSLAVRQRA